VLAKEEIDYVKTEIINKYNLTKVTGFVEGGRERQESVYNGLRAIENCNVVAIHDGARPFISDYLIEKGIVYAEKYGACACGVKPKDTIKIVDSNGFSIDTPNRDSLISVQTPQCFDYDVILQCHKKAATENFKATDDTMIVERYGHKVYLYEGDYKNIKITTPEDILLGEEILKHVE
jgi:2-C-methyl-D-erythritol 4-phosphate cytidylyltransferase